METNSQTQRKREKGQKERGKIGEEE